MLRDADCSYVQNLKFASFITFLLIPAFQFSPLMMGVVLVFLIYLEGDGSSPKGHWSESYDKKIFFLL